jgi:hypothetical protein
MADSKPLRRFVLLGGTYTHPGENPEKKIFYKGEVIETTLNLAKMFGDTMFREVSAGAATVAQLMSPSAPAPVAPVAPASQEDTAGNVQVPEMPPSKSPLSALGEDVTDKFPNARENDLIVLHSGKNYFVADRNQPDTAMNDDETHGELTSITKAKAFIDEFLSK